jgi:Tfp pilus assembly protein PilO
VVDRQTLNDEKTPDILKIIITILLTLIVSLGTLGYYATEGDIRDNSEDIERVRQEFAALKADISNLREQNARLEEVLQAFMQNQSEQMDKIYDEVKAISRDRRDP